MQPAFAFEIENVEVELLEWEKYELEKSDVFMFRLSLSNNGNTASEIVYDYVLLEDSQKRFYSPDDAEIGDLVGKVSVEDCPYLGIIDINPGLSVEKNFCFQVPKGIETTISIKFHEHTPDNCERYADCIILTFPFELVLESVESEITDSKIPDWVKSTMQWYLDGIVSEDEMINALQFLIKEGIIKV